MRQADEGVLIDFAMEYSDKRIVLRNDYFDFADSTLRVVKELPNVYFEYDHLIEPREEEVGKWYCRRPAVTFFELRSLLNFNPAFVCIAAPLTFQIEKVKRICGETPIRMIVNGYSETYPRPYKQVCATFVRPEDVVLYEGFIDTMEFGAHDLAQEATLLKTFQAGEWPGNLNVLFPKLGINIDNRAIPEDFGKARIKCAQRCMDNETCHLCENALQFAIDARAEHYKRLSSE